MRLPGLTAMSMSWKEERSGMRVMKGEGSMAMIVRMQSKSWRAMKMAMGTMMLMGEEPL